MKAQTYFLLLTSMFLLSCKTSKKIQNPQKENAYFWTASWKSSGELIAVGGTQDTLRILSSITHRLISNHPFEGVITQVKWHPNKNKLAIAMQGGKTKSCIFFPDTDKRITLDSLDDFGARAIGWNKTGTLLAVGDYSGFLTIYNENGTLIKRVYTGQKSLIGLDWHPKKDIIVTVGELISIYEYEKDSITSIKPRKEEVLMLCVAWHPSGDLFATGDYGDFEKDYPPLVQYWTPEGQNFKNITKSKSEYRTIKWSSDGKYLATASNFLGLWTQDGELVKAKTVKHLLWGMDWNPANDKIVTTDAQGRLVIWDGDLRQVKNLGY